MKNKKLMKVLSLILFFMVVRGIIGDTFSSSEIEYPSSEEVSSSSSFEEILESGTTILSEIFESSSTTVSEYVEPSESSIEESTENGIETNELRVVASEIPEYTGEKNLFLNNNKSGLSFDSEIKAYVQFSTLDTLNRVQFAEAVITPESYVGSANRDKESNISNIKPTGWKNKRVDNSYIYNRSHLIGYAFFGNETDTIYNLMTGTAQFNQNRDWGMLHYETIVQEAVKNGKTVKLEVNPVFRDNNLLAIGVQMRALSSDDEIDFNVFIYNVQDNLTINYENGESVKK